MRISTTVARLSAHDIQEKQELKEIYTKLIVGAVEHELQDVLSFTEWLQNDDLSVTLTVGQLEAVEYFLTHAWERFNTANAKLPWVLNQLIGELELYFRMSR